MEEELVNKEAQLKKEVRPHRKKNFVQVQGYSIPLQYQMKKQY